MFAKNKINGQFLNKLLFYLSHKIKIGIGSPFPQKNIINF
jgi:hypothetical protein